MDTIRSRSLRIRCIPIPPAVRRLDNGRNRLPSPSALGEPGPYRVAQTFHVVGEGGGLPDRRSRAQAPLRPALDPHDGSSTPSTGKTVADEKRNHGVALVPSAGRGFITDGSDASVTVFDLKTYAVLGKVEVADNADGVIYDPASGKVLGWRSAGTLVVPIPISPDLSGRKVVGHDAHVLHAWTRRNDLLTGLFGKVTN